MKNCFDRTPHTMKDWLLLAAGVAAVFAAADWLPGVLRGAGAFLGLLAPFGWGLLLAYVLDIPTRFFAQKIFGGRRGGAMAVCSLVGNVYEVFEISGFTSLLRVFSDRAQALAEL